MLMEYVQLGNSGLRVSGIAVGCMSLADDAASERILQKAVDAGINFFDTADLYQAGANESMVGRALRAVRDRVVIATKVGNRLRADGSGWDWDPSPEYIRSAVEKSLGRLGTDCIDLYQLHGGTIEDPIDDIIATLEDLKTAGKIRSYGISSIRPNVIREWVRRSKLSSVMMQYSLLDRRPEEECLLLLHENGVGVLARGPLAQGLLLGKPAKQQPGRTVQEVEKVQQEISAIIGDNQSMAMALGFVLANPAISSAVVGLRTEEQLTTLLDSLQDPMPDEDMISGLNAIAPATRYDQHR